jgi:hypothetical protein
MAAIAPVCVALLGLIGAHPDVNGTPDVAPGAEYYSAIATARVCYWLSAGLLVLGASLAIVGFVRERRQ